jgi:hypothetical protein
MSEKRNQARRIELTFYAAHGPDRQRAHQIVCLMVGFGPDKFAEAADKAKLPKARQKTCRDDYNIASSSWSKALKPHLRGAVGGLRRAAPDPPQTFNKQSSLVGPPRDEVPAG